MSSGEDETVRPSEAPPTKKKINSTAAAAWDPRAWDSIVLEGEAYCHRLGITRQTIHRFLRHVGMGSKESRTRGESFTSFRAQVRFGGGKKVGVGYVRLTQLYALYRHKFDFQMQQLAGAFGVSWGRPTDHFAAWASDWVRQTQLRQWLDGVENAAEASHAMGRDELVEAFFRSKQCAEVDMEFAPELKETGSEAEAGKDPYLQPPVSHSPPPPSPPRNPNRPDWNFEIRPERQRRRSPRRKRDPYQYLVVWLPPLSEYTVRALYDEWTEALILDDRCLPPLGELEKQRKARSVGERVYRPADLRGEIFKREKIYNYILARAQEDFGEADDETIDAVIDLIQGELDATTPKKSLRTLYYLITGYKQHHKARQPKNDYDTFYL